MTEDEYVPVEPPAAPRVGKSGHSESCPRSHGFDESCTCAAPDSGPLKQPMTAHAKARKWREANESRIFEAWPDSDISGAIASLLDAYAADVLEGLANRLRAEAAKLRKGRP